MCGATATVSNPRSSGERSRPAFDGEQRLLGGGLPVDAVEGERKLFSLVLGTGDLDQRQGFPLVDAVGAHNDIAVELFLQQRADARNNTHRHCASTRREGKEKQQKDAGWRGGSN
jgi:hypothetical protein